MRIMRRTQKGTVVSEIDCTARKGKSLFLICRYGRYEDMDTVIEIPELSSMEQEQLENELLEKGYLDISRYDWAVCEFFFRCGTGLVEHSGRERKISMNPRMYVETIEIKESAGRENQEGSSFPVWLLRMLGVALGVGIAVETTLVILLGRAIVEMRELSVLLQYFR